MGKKIAVIDDEKKISSLLEAFLQPKGYEVLLAYDGLQGYQLVEEHVPDLVIVDVLLPHLNGFEVCRKIKENPKLAHIPVILMTAIYKKARYKLEGKRAGAEDYIDKPFEFSDLLGRIQAYVPLTEAAAPDASGFQDQLRLLRKAYWEQLPDKIYNIKDTWQQLQKTRWNEESFRAVHRMVHGLHGSGATYGFTALTNTARALEYLLQTILESRVPPSEEQRKTITEHLDALDEIALAGDIPPVLEAPKEPAAPAAEKEARTVTAAPGPENRTVFLYSENEGFLQELSAQLSHFNYQVECFATVSALLDEKLNERHPLSILMDVALSELDLTAMLDVARIKQNFQSTPLLVVADLGDMMARLEAVRAGAEGYLTHPVDAIEVVGKLEQLTHPDAPEAYRILIVEDDAGLADHYSGILRQAGMTAQIVTDPMAVLGSLSEFKPDLILMDLYMGNCSGQELATVIRLQDEHISVPLVYLSKETNVARQLEALMPGGDDFLTKPIDADHLIAAVTHRARRWRLLRSLMVHDSLTGLLNHTRLKAQLDTEVTRASRQYGSLSFAILDIDQFKAVNDTYGHPAGDRLLKSLARMLQQRLRKTDVIGRSGGNEFSLILPETDGQAAVKKLDEIRQGFAQVRQHTDGQEYFITFSCGIATLPPFMDAKQLSTYAEHALAAAKYQGRNCVALASPE